MYRINKGKLSVAMLNAGVDTSKRLAELSGVSVNTISRLNNGGSVKLPTLQAMALGISSKTGYALTHVPGFPVIRIGHRVRVSREGLAEWVKANEGNKLEVAL